MSLTVPFLPLRLRSDDVGGGEALFLCMLLLLVLRESTGGVLIIQQLFNSVKLGKRDPKMAAGATAAACNLHRCCVLEM